MTTFHACMPCGWRVSGTTTRPLRGWSWVNNDLVNLLSSLGGGLVAAGLGLWLL